MIDEVLRFLGRGCAERADAPGIAPERIVLDPGIGFGKNADHNIAVLRDRSTPGRAWLSDAARHVAQIHASENSPDANRRSASSGRRDDGAGGRAGIDIVRVHDVAAARDAVRVSDAIVRDWRPDGWTE